MQLNDEKQGAFSQHAIQLTLLRNKRVDNIYLILMTYFQGVNRLHWNLLIYLYEGIKSTNAVAFLSQVERSFFFCQVMFNLQTGYRFSPLFFLQECLHQHLPSLHLKWNNCFRLLAYAPQSAASVPEHVAKSNHASFILELKLEVGRVNFKDVIAAHLSL